MFWLFELRLYQLITMLRTLFGEVPISRILGIIRQLSKIGFPPDIDDEENLRHWLAGLVPTLDEVAKLTPNELDDNAVILLHTAISVDEAWEAFYAIVTMASDGKVKADVNAQVLSDKVGIDIPTIIAIIEAILEIIDMLKER